MRILADDLLLKALDAVCDSALRHNGGDALEPVLMIKSAMAECLQHNQADLLTESPPGE